MGKRKEGRKGVREGGKEERERERERVCAIPLKSFETLEG